jgi:hypothetical protein
VGLGLAALLLAPLWGAGVVANAGFVAFQRLVWPAAVARWDSLAAGVGPRGEWLRLESSVNERQNNNFRAWELARRAADAAPGAPLILLQLGVMRMKMLDHDTALDSWRQAGAAPYFCTQAAQALYATTPPDLDRAVDAATICTALDPAAGAGWLVLGQAQAARGQDQAALAAFGPAYDRLLAAGQPGRAAVAAATAAGIAARSGAGAAIVTDWMNRAHALVPAVCADPARPRDPNLDALCATP